MKRDIAPPDAVRRFYKTTVAVEWGARVDERIQTLGLSGAEVARLVGTTPQTIHKIRRGQIVPREYLRVMIALTLGCEVDRLFPTPSRDRLMQAVAA